nr:MAG TPA: hypothetical protein [Caudoviricetes sp.]
MTQSSIRKHNYHGGFRYYPSANRHNISAVLNGRGASDYNVKVGSAKHYLMAT